MSNIIYSRCFCSNSVFVLVVGRRSCLRMPVLLNCRILKPVNRSDWGCVIRVRHLLPAASPLSMLALHANLQLSSLRNVAVPRVLNTRDVARPSLSSKIEEGTSARRLRRNNCVEHWCVAHLSNHHELP
jgi:hypothetical protein